MVGDITATTTKKIPTLSVKFLNMAFVLESSCLLQGNIFVVF